MIKYFKTKPEKKKPNFPTQAKQVCFETLNMLNIKIVALFLKKSWEKQFFIF